MKNCIPSCLMIFGLMVNQSASEIDSILFKDISHYFRYDYLYLSPTVGRIALDTGLIHNLRFFGNVTAGVKRSDPCMRHYVCDTGNDALMRLVILLFPSPTGALSSATTATSNFGRIATPHNVALLLQYAHYCRHPTVNLDTIRQTLLAPFGGSSNKDKRHTINTILHSIHLALYEETYSMEPYPVFTTEQIILAFFVKQFNTKNDMCDLLAGLPECVFRPNYATRLTPDNPDFYDDNVWTDSVLKATINGHISSNDLDCVYACNFIHFPAPVPYWIGNNPIQNNSCSLFHRHTNILDSRTFPDCIEVMLRHFTNLVLYDAHRKDFHIPSELLIGAPYLENLIQFYAVQSPARVNDGSLEMRGLWNRVVGDLNEHSDDETNEGTSTLPKIHYMLKTNRTVENDLSSGYVNIIHLWQHLLGSSFQREPYQVTWDITAKQEWVINSFDTLIKTLNPAFTEVAIETRGLLEYQKGDENPWMDLFGCLKITLRHTDPFSFTMDLSLTHGAVVNIHYNTEKANSIILALPDGTLSDSSFRGMSPVQLVNIKAVPCPLPFYQLFAPGIRRY